MEALTFKSLTFGESVIVETTNLKRLHHVVASRCIHGKNGRFDVVTVEIDEKIEATGFSSPRYFSVWFANVPDFLRLFKRAFTKCSSSNGLNTSQSKECNSCEYLNVKEFCLPQYFEVLGAEKLKMNKLSKSLDIFGLDGREHPRIQEICYRGRNTDLFRFREFVALSTSFREIRCFSSSIRQKLAQSVNFIITKE